VGLAVAASLMFCRVAIAQTVPQDLPNMLVNGDFGGTSIAPWQTQVNLCQGVPCDTYIQASIVNGQMDISVQDGGVSSLDAQVGQVLTGSIVAGHLYAVSFWARAIDPVQSGYYPVSVQISNMGNMDFATLVLLPDVDPSTGQAGRNYDFTFTADHTDAAPWLGLFVAGHHESAEILLDDFVVGDLTTYVPGSGGTAGTGGAGGSGDVGGASGAAGSGGSGAANGGSNGVGGASGAGGSSGAGGWGGAGGSSGAGGWGGAGAPISLGGSSGRGGWSGAGGSGPGGAAGNAGAAGRGGWSETGGSAGRGGSAAAASMGGDGFSTAGAAGSLASSGGAGGSDHRGSSGGCSFGGSPPPAVFALGVAVALLGTRRRGRAGRRER